MTGQLDNPLMMRRLEIETEITRYNIVSYNDLVLINGDQGQPLVRINTGNVLTIYYINT